MQRFYFNKSKNIFFTNNIVPNLIVSDNAVLFGSDVFINLFKFLVTRPCTKNPNKAPPEVTNQFSLKNFFCPKVSIITCDETIKIIFLINLILYIEDFLEISLNSFR